MLKKTLIIAGSLLLLTLVSVIVLPFVFRDQIAAAVKAEASNQLRGKIDFGDIDLTLIKSFPDFTVSIQNLSISGEGPFAHDTLYHAANTALTLDLMSVINGETYRVKQIILDAPRISALVLADSSANWDIAPVDTSATPQAESSSPFSMAIDKIVITDGRIYYADATADMAALLSGVNFEGSGDFNEERYNFRTRTLINSVLYTMSGIDYLSDAVVEMTADLEIDNTLSKYTFRENELKINELLLGFDGYVAMPEEAMDMDIRFNTRKTDFSNILSLIPAVYSRDFESIKTSGKIELSGFVKGKMDDYSMPAYSMQMQVENGMFSYPDLPESVKNINLDLLVNNPDGQEDNLLIDIRKFKMEMAGNPFEMRMKVSTPVSDPAIDGVIKGKINLASLSKIMPMENGEEYHGELVADITAKGRVSSLEHEQYDKFNLAGQLSLLNILFSSPDDPYDVDISRARLNFSPQFVELNSFEGKIGNSDISARGRLDNLMEYFLKDDILSGSFTMNSKKMDLNQFMTDEEESVESTGEDSTGIMAIPSNIDFSLKANIDELIYENMIMTAAVADLLIRNSRATILQLSTNVFGGNMKIDGYYDTSEPSSPLFDLNLKVQNISIKEAVDKVETIGEMAPAARYASGRVSSEFSVKGSMDEQMNPVYSSLKGLGKLNTSQVMITGFSLFEKISDLLKMPQLNPLRITDISPSFLFENGRISFTPFPVKFGNIKGMISGSNGFDQTIDYLWKLEVPAGAAGAQAETMLRGLASKAGMSGISGTSQIPVDVKIGGTVSDPDIKVDISTFTTGIKEQVSTQVEEKVEEVKEDLKAKASEEAERLLKAAQVQADRIKAEARAAADKVKKEGYAAAAKLEAEAKNPVARVAAKKAADKMRQETDKKSADIISESNRKADQIMAEARRKANELTR